MKRKLFLPVYIYLSFCISAWGQIVVIEEGVGKNYVQFSHLDILDWASMECIYEYRVRDADKSETYFDILQLGKEYTKYFG